MGALPQHRQGMDDQLIRLAHTQSGLVTTSQALDLGWDRRSLGAATREHILGHVCRGLYAVWTPDLETPAGRHAALSRGAALTYPDAILANVSAVAAHDLPVMGAIGRRAFLERPVRAEVLTQGYVIRPRSAPEDEVEAALPGWGRCVSPATAIVQHTLEHGVMPGVVAADAAIHRGDVCVPELADAAARTFGWPRSARATTMLAMVDGRSESVGESRLRLDLRTGGIDVTPQAVIRDGEFVARVDFLVDGSKVVIEFDGLVKYRDGGADALIAEKRREDHLRALGYIVVRVTWAELANPARVLARVRQAIAIGRRFPRDAA